MSDEQQYINFDEYIRQGEPSKREAAYAWSTAIGLQAVDGLKTSEYLNDLARRNIEGEITIDEVDKLLRSYYESKTVREADDDDKEEADKASKNIKRILSSDTLNFTTCGFISLHRRIFDGVFKHAGELYLRSLGFCIENDLFAKHSWYFRNALVRANYKNVIKGVDYSPVYLERFFRNLLLGEQWDLRNRYLHIHPTQEWSVQPNLTDPTSTRTSTGQVPEQVQDLLHTNNPLIVELIKVIGDEEVSVAQLMERTGLKHRPNFIEYHLNPAITDGYVRLLYPQSPRHPRQKYLLTEKGIAYYNELKKHGRD